MHAAGRAASAILLGLMAACGAPATGVEPSPVLAGATPGISGDWTWVSAQGGGLWVALPPWLVAFDTQGAVFANEPGPRQGLQLLAEGAGAQAPQPAPAEVERWLRERLRSPIEGVADADRVELPSGVAVHIGRLDGAGTAAAWRIEAWAIQTADGVRFLQVDGPPVAWEGREADVQQIATRIRFDAPPEPGPQPGKSPP